MIHKQKLRSKSHCIKYHISIIQKYKKIMNLEFAYYDIPYTI